MREILRQATELAASSSIMMGELPEMELSHAEDLLGEAGLLATLSSASHAR